MNIFQYIYSYLCFSTVWILISIFRLSSKPFHISDFFFSPQPRPIIFYILMYIFTCLFIALTRQRKVLNILGAVGDAAVQVLSVICFKIHPSGKIGPHQQLEDVSVSCGKNKGCRFLGDLWGCSESRCSKHQQRLLMQVKKQLPCSLHHHQAKVTPGYKGAVPVSKVLETLAGRAEFHFSAEGSDQDSLMD